MSDEENDYELERQKTIAENRALFETLGLQSARLTPLGGSSPAPASDRSKSKPKPSSKRKAPAPPSGEGPRRRSGRIAGLEADGETLRKIQEEDARAVEVQRVVNRKEREKVMDVAKMSEDATDEENKDMEKFLSSMAETPVPRPYPSEATTAKEAYADKETASVELQRLKGAFTNMSLKANTKVTNERVFSMTVHPEKKKTLVFVGDKYGQLGIWDALGPVVERADNDDDTNGVKEEEEADTEGPVWRIQAHARNSITCMKVDPVNGSGLFTSAYDCSLRHIDFSTLKSTELFAFSDEDMLINHFDLTPNGQEAWLVDKNGGINHVDFRVGKKDQERRRWVVQDLGRGAKLGGISVNPIQPHIICTASNDQHVRIWDTRYLANIPSTPFTDGPLPTPPPTAKGQNVKNESGEGVPETGLLTQSSLEAFDRYFATAKGKATMLAQWQHGKSCSSAYWDPWGRRILTTSYDDKLRVFNVSPEHLLLQTPYSPATFKPSTVVPHDCQTGRWLTILRAQWSTNMDYMPHFTVGNMKRRLDVISANGDRIAGLWTDGVTAVPAVTASHPGVVDRVLGGNTSGRIQLWSSGDL
ncbi:hypothetical protein IAT38_007069 [Cryptococcus sp. DSM 104549]